MHKSSYKKFEIIKYEKGIKREPSNEKSKIISKILKNIKDINRKDCGNLSKYVKR
jgi:hypothetical protein